MGSLCGLGLRSNQTLACSSHRFCSTIAPACLACRTDNRWRVLWLVWCLRDTILFSKVILNQNSFFLSQIFGMLYTKCLTHYSPTSKTLNQQNLEILLHIFRRIPWHVPFVFLFYLKKGGCKVIAKCKLH